MPEVLIGTYLFKEKEKSVFSFVADIRNNFWHDMAEEERLNKL